MLELQQMIKRDEKMIANRLNVLMAERQLTIKDVVEGTSLSRNTISNLINKNMSNSVNLSTLNRLCMFLKVSPKDFFVYSPFDIEFSGSSGKLDENDSFIMNFIVHHFEDVFVTEDKVQVKIPTRIEKGKSSKKRVESYRVIYASQNYYEEPSSSATERLRRSVEFEENKGRSLSEIVNSLDIMFQNVTKTMIENKLNEAICSIFNFKKATEKQFSDDSTSVYLVDYTFPWGQGKANIFVKNAN